MYFTQVLMSLFTLTITSPHFENKIHTFTPLRFPTPPSLLQNMQKIRSELPDPLWIMCFFQQRLLDDWYEWSVVVGKEVLIIIMIIIWIYFAEKFNYKTEIFAAGLSNNVVNSLFFCFVFQFVFANFKNRFFFSLVIFILLDFHFTKGLKKKTSFQ